MPMLLGAMFPHRSPIGGLCDPSWKLWTALSHSRRHSAVSAVECYSR